MEQALEAMGVPPESRNDASAVVDPKGSGPRLFFQRVPEEKRAKNRVHLDVRAAPGLTGDARMAGLEAEAVRLVSHGATRLSRYEPAPPLSAGHIVMADPEGNELPASIDAAAHQPTPRTPMLCKTPRLTGRRFGSI